MYINRANYKMLAIIFMVIDHAGVLLFNNNLLMRLIGRLAFPMFVYLLYDGYKNSRDLAAYGRRMVGFWAVSILPYSLAFYNCLVSIYQNTFLSLYLYLAVFCVLEDRALNIRWKYAFALVCTVLAERLHMEYGWYGVALAVVIYEYDDNLQAANQFMWITCLECLWNMNPRQCTAPLAIALTPARFTKSKRPPTAFKIFNYAFYPLHLLILWALSVLY